MIRAAVWLSLLVVAGQAQALSCLAADAATSFSQASASEDSYVVLRGSFDFDESLMPNSDRAEGTGDPPPVPARFEGLALGQDGFSIPYETELWMQPSCIGPWCGSQAPTDNAVAFARDNGSGVYIIELGACPMWMFPADPDVIATIESCMNGGPCTPAN